jgi:ABC-type Fe3+-siderophore transport system permease subunit
MKFLITLFATYFSTLLSALSELNFEVRSGVWYLKSFTNGAVEIAPGYNSKVTVLSYVEKPIFDALMFKDKIKKSMKVSPLPDDSETERLPFQITIYEGGKKITGISEDGILWNEMMAIILPQTYPDKNSYVWKSYVEGKQAVIPDEYIKVKVRKNTGDGPEAGEPTNQNTTGVDAEPKSNNLSKQTDSTQIQKQTSWNYLTAVLFGLALIVSGFLLKKLLSKNSNS